MQLSIRPLTSFDREEYHRAVLGRMSAQSRYLRFASPKPGLSRRELDYLTEIDGEQHVALLALDGSVGVGVARYVRTGGSTAEIAVGVADAWQGRGVATRLLAELFVHARAHGIRTLTATTLAENAAAIALVRGSGFTLSGRSGAMLEYRRSLTV